MSDNERDEISRENENEVDNVDTEVNENKDEEDNDKGENSKIRTKRNIIDVDSTEVLRKRDHLNKMSEVNKNILDSDDDEEKNSSE